MRDELPNGWISTNLEQVVLHKKGKKPKETIRKPKDGFVPYILIDEMEGKPIRAFTKDEKVPIAKEDDVLIVWDGSIGKTATGMRGAIGSTITALSPIVIKSDFLNAFLKLAKPIIEQTSRGTGLQHINPTTFWPLTFPLPPFNEQKHIVAKLDHIMPKIDGVKERLERIPQIIKRFRQSVLNAAVTGKLTEKWREEHSEVERAEVLLDRVRKERERKYQEDCKIAQKKGRRKPKKYRLNTDTIKIVNKIFKWTWERLVNIADISGGVTKGRNLRGTNCVQLPYLRVANVQDGFLDLVEMKKIEIKRNEIEKYLLKAGDILFTEGGDRDKLGRGTVWYNEIANCIHQNHVFKARVDLNLILPEYISLATKSEYSKKYFIKVASQTVNLASINITNLGDLPIPICPFEEQREIVRQVDKLFAFADKLEEHYKKAKEKVDKFPQSVLAKAFRGELVPQDPNDEPAEKLLERIKEEKAKMEAELKKTKKNVGGRKKAK